MLPLLRSVCCVVNLIAPRMFPVCVSGRPGGGVGNELRFRWVSPNSGLSPPSASPSLPPSPSSQQQQIKLKAPSGAPEVSLRGFRWSQPGPSKGDALKPPAGCDIHFARLTGCRFSVTCLFYFFSKTAPKPRLFIFCACAPRGFFSSQ